MGQNRTADSSSTAWNSSFLMSAFAVHSAYFPQWSIVWTMNPTSICYLFFFLTLIRPLRLPGREISRITQPIFCCFREKRRKKKKESLEKRLRARQRNGGSSEGSFWQWPLLWSCLTRLLSGSATALGGIGSWTFIAPCPSSRLLACRPRSRIMRKPLYLAVKDACCYSADLKRGEISSHPSRG